MDAQVELSKNQWVVLSQQHYYTHKMRYMALSKIRSEKL